MSAFRNDLFAGRSVLITGGSSGIGLAISRAFAAHGATVHIVARSQEKLDTAKATIEAAGGAAEVHAADVRDAQAIAAIAVKPDVLVNAAAGNFPVPFSAMSDGAWKAVMDIVVQGTVHCTRTFGPSCSSIINVVAGYAWTGAPGVSHSGAAKAAVLNLTKSLAVEWAPIRVNAVSPGPIAGTEGMKRLGEDLGLDGVVLNSIPLSRMGEADEIGSACLFLASEAASYVTGACLVVDGGQDAMGPFGAIFKSLSG